MKSIIFLILFIGIIFIIDGVYRDEIEYLKNQKHIEYKFIPKYSYTDIFSKNNKHVINDVFNQDIDIRSGKTT